MAVVQSLIDTNWVGPAVFAAMTLALLLLAAYLALWATLDTSYVRMLAYMLAVLSLAFAAALGYETAAVATQAFPPFPASPTAHSKGNPVGCRKSIRTQRRFGPTLPMLAEHHQVIAVDLQGHGRTADIDRPIDVRLMADDIAALIDHLGLDRPDIVGYSLGGGVALHTAAKYPAKVRRLVAASANIRPDAIYRGMRAQQAQVSAAAAEFMKDTPMYQLYQRVAPRPEDFPRLLDKIGESTAIDFDYSDEVRSLRVPTLIVCADADMAPPSHYVEIFKLLGGGLRDGGWMSEGRPEGGHALAILPGLTHYDLGTSPLFATATLAFLDERPSTTG